MGERFSYPLRVRYGECDPQGIVFNANYLLYCDVAFTELWRAAVGPWQQMLERGYDAVVADAHLSFRAPARFDDELALRAHVTHLGRTAIVTASVLLLVARAGRGGLRLAFAADLFGTALIIVLCAASGGARSPFAILYLFAIGHAAAFQPRSRLGLAMLAVLLGFLAPLAYESVPAAFGAVVCIGVVLSALTAGFVHFALDSIRRQRRRLKLVLSATASLSASLDPTETVRDFARAVIPELADVCVVDLLD